MRFFATVSLYDSNSMDEVKPCNGEVQTRHGLLQPVRYYVVMTSLTCRRCEISKKLTWNPTLTAKNTPLFLFPYMGHSLQIFAWGMPLHAHVFSFTNSAVVLSHFRCVHPENQLDEIFSILTFSSIKINVAYTRLEVIAKHRSALQVEFITGVKLICYFVLYYCFLHWDHLPNMAVGDLAFYCTLYLWCKLKNEYHKWYTVNPYQMLQATIIMYNLMFVAKIKTQQNKAKTFRCSALSSRWYLMASRPSYVTYVHSTQNT